MDGKKTAGRVTAGKEAVNVIIVDMAEDITDEVAATEMVRASKCIFQFVCISIQIQ